jgi:hypothetical protein
MKSRPKGAERIRIDTDGPRWPVLDTRKARALDPLNARAVGERPFARGPRRGLLPRGEACRRTDAAVTGRAGGFAAAPRRRSCAAPDS